MLSELVIELKEYFRSFIDFVPTLLMATLVVVIFLIIIGWLRKRIMSTIRPKMDDPLLANFLNRIFRIINIIIGFLLFLYLIGKTAMATGLLGAAGVSAFVIGFAFKDIGENFLAGIIMAFNRPFRLGDVIKTEDVEGKIVGLNLRDTHIKTFDGKDVYVPNGQIVKNPLQNYTIDGFMRYDFTIGLDYGSNIDQAKSILLDVVSNQEDVLGEDKSPSVMISDLGASTINLKVQYWLNTFAGKHPSSQVKTKAINDSLEALDRAGFNMPGDVVELKNYNKEKLNLGSEEESKPKLPPAPDSTKTDSQT